MKKGLVLFGLLVFVAMAGMGQEAVVNANLMFFVDGIAISDYSQLDAIDGARIVRDDPNETIAYSRGDTDYIHGKSEANLNVVGKAINATIQDPDGTRHQVKIVVRSARQTGKNTYDIEYDTYLRFPNRDTRK